jgi:hypothetical protein
VIEGKVISQTDHAYVVQLWHINPDYTSTIEIEKHINIATALDELLKAVQLFSFRTNRVPETKSEQK